MSIRVRPVTAAEAEAFEALFSAKGCPGFCWCAAYRFQGAPRMDRKARRAAMRGLIDAEVPVGVLAFEGETPVGWCSVAPRETYAKLATSRTMPQVDDAAWTVLCLFVRREWRGRGVTRALLAGALRYAKAQGARVVEAYPWDTAGLSPTGPAAHWGHSRVYAQAGFRQEGRSRSWTRKLGR